MELLIKLFFIFLGFCGVHPFFISSQNLINNGSFDTYTRCPNRISQLAFATGWTSSGSADLFCKCSSPKSPVNPDLSFVGSLEPHSGNCYAGFIVNPRYKEYVIYELPQKMKKRATYCIRFLYSRSVFSAVKVDSLGIYLHEETHGNAARGQPIYERTQVVKIEDRPGIWTAVSFTFHCNGGERYITIGSFGHDLKKADYLPSEKNKKNTRVFNYATSAYYFIDDVELIRLRKGETCLPVTLPPEPLKTLPLITPPTVVEIDTFVPTKPFILPQLNFETAKSTIVPSSYEELDELVDHLMSQPELNLYIMGHTDNRGNEKMNMELSEARVRSVVNYLVSKGINSERLSWKGFGDKSPELSNSTEAGRARNRRVEFQFK